MNQDSLLLKLLEDTGFHEKEAQVYLALLELGQGTVNEIAKITELKRPIIYVLLEGLLKRGYASEIPSKKINTFQATDPSVLSAKISSTAKNFSEMLPVMRTLHNKEGKRPKISYYETPEAIQKIFVEINDQREAFFVTSLARIEKYFPGTIGYWHKSYKKGLNKLTSRTIVPNTEENIQLAKKFLKTTKKVEIRTLENLKDCSIDFSLYGDKLAITSFGDKPSMVVISSEGIADSVLPIFEIAWKSAAPIGA